MMMRFRSHFRSRSHFHSRSLFPSLTRPLVDEDVAEMAVADAEEVVGDAERRQRLRPLGLQEDERLRRRRQRTNAATKKIPRDQRLASTLQR